jgi:hypothetical protein
MAYKIVSKIIGDIRVNNKTLGYDSFIIVDEITPEIDILRQNKVIKVSTVQIKNADKVLIKKNVNTENVEVIKENKNKNKNNEIKENKDK